MTRLALAVATAGLGLLVLASWRLRTTPIGRSLLGYAGACLLRGLAPLISPEHFAVGGSSAVFATALSLVAATCALRLASQAASDRGRLEPVSEAMHWAPPLFVVLLGDARLEAVATGLLYALAGVRLTRMPMRSWGGFGTALRITSAAMFAPGLVAIARLMGAPGAWIGIADPMAALGLGVVLSFGLRRLGFLSSDRVQYGSVIEAMNDGVLVVDMDGRLVDFNQSAREILELDERTSRLRPLDEALVDHPDLVELFNGAIDGRSLYAPEAMRRRGEPRTYDLELSALYDGAGSIQSRILVLRDISERIEIEAENRRQARHVRLAHQVSAAVHEAETIESGLEAALALIARTMGYSLGHFLRSAETPEGSRLAATGIIYRESELDALREEVDGGPLDLRVSPSPARESRDEDESRLAEGLPTFDPRGVFWWRELGFHAALTLPVLIGPRLYGLFEFFTRERSDVEVEDATSEMLEHVGELVGRAVERKLAEEKIRRLAYRDDLTGLPNRQRFQQLLRGAVALAARGQRRMALIFMDLDGFKKVNDTLGHDVGDRLLAEVASRFSRVVRVSDHVGRQQYESSEPSVSRLGGDEFTVLLTEISDPDDAGLVASRLLATLEAPIVLDGQELFMSTSIGIAVFPEDGTDAETLLRNADAAMYFAKGRGRNGYQFYSEEMNRTRSGRIELEARLRGAVERESFQLYYQPLLDSGSGRVVAAEALLRWIDDERGPVPPDEFIPVAEETGLIVALGRWVFRTACQQARRWRDETGSSIRIGVNVSGHQIREPGMVDMVRQALEESGVSPGQVELEITESTIMQDDALTVRTLRELKEMGVGLALDDFGTGYSSLSYLRRFTIDRVKIDRSFVNELPENADDAALTAAIIAMCHGLRLKVVAEGVETTRQALFLRQRGCDELQGYLFGRPAPPEEFVDLLRAKPRTLEQLEKEEHADADGEG
ncbi:MAG: EAL domain-containing protein [Spirochaetaceae bacterium]|nr:EAL domain-containing protein [Myxococcales bacterium]MCB9723645.1 EAL domain-containing protein [Spirochaetaceae bacterium]